jgi:predicted RNase H-like HicB family nuclease
MTFTVEIQQEDDGRWIAEVPELPGTLTYGQTPEEAKAKVQGLALRVVADRLEHGEAGPDLLSISFAAAWVPGPARERGESIPRCCV